MKYILLVLLLFGSVNAMAQGKGEGKPTAYASIDGILKEFLRLISSDQGKAKDIEAIRNLFLPTASFTVNTHDDSVARPVETVGLEDFLTLLKDPYYEKDFKEIELHKIVEEYNGIAHAFQTYQASDIDNHNEKGITSYQLVFFDKRWWIVNVLWTGNSNGVDIPKKYAKKNSNK